MSRDGARRCAVTGLRDQETLSVLDGRHAVPGDATRHAAGRGAIDCASRRRAGVTTCFADQEKRIFLDSQCATCVKISLIQ
jgi:hypothetical protein